LVEFCIIPQTLLGSGTFLQGPYEGDSLAPGLLVGLHEATKVYKSKG
jgi:hypothetical protein